MVDVVRPSLSPSMRVVVGVVLSVPLVLGVVIEGAFMLIVEPCHYLSATVSVYLSMKRLLILLLVLPLFCNAQRNEYEKRFLEVTISSSGLFQVACDDLPRKRVADLVYSDGEEVKSFAGMIAYLEELGFELHLSMGTSFSVSGHGSSSTVILFKHEKEFKVISGKIIFEAI